MTTASVTFTFPDNSLPTGSQANVNFQDLVKFLNDAFVIESYTALSASDVAGPSGKGILMLVRDSTNGGTALVIYDTGDTPSIIDQVGAGTTFVTAVPGAGEIQVKNRTGNGGIDFLAHSSTNNAALKVASLIVEA